MPRSFATISEFLDHGFDALIDVRSPSEFAEDRVPGAISLPVLSDAQRAEVGTIFVQDSPFTARKLGAALVARNAADHIAGPLAQHDGAWRPLVYCWRGGQRSGSFASILSQIGWRAETVDGGYRSWRRLVQAYLYVDPLPHRLVLIDGFTGSAKTDLLVELAELGTQVLDLEGLANHRGSLLGDRPGGQPAQKGFETAVAEQLSRFDPARPVIAEAESSKVGRLSLPPSLWAAMMSAPRIDIAAPLDARAAYLARAYADLSSEAEVLEDKLRQLVPHRGQAVVDGWLALLHAGEMERLAAALMADHYDPAYARSRAAHPHEIMATVRIETLDAPGLKRAAAEIQRLVEG